MKITRMAERDLNRVVDLVTTTEGPLNEPVHVTFLAIGDADGPYDLHAVVDREAGLAAYRTRGISERRAHARAKDLLPGFLSEHPAVNRLIMGVRS